MRAIALFLAAALALAACLALVAVAIVDGWML